MLNNVEFAYNFVLWALLLIPIYAFWYYFKNKNLKANYNYSSLKIFDKVRTSLKERLIHIPFILRLLALAFLIIAAARPQTFSTGENIYTEGIDIVMLLDISGSMLAEDFRPNRLDAAKNEITDFIEGRTTDKIGLVIFAKESFTQCPLTIDYKVLRSLLSEIKSGMLEDGTAIGTAIANGVNRLKDSDAKSKVMILLTDGVNNSGEIDPITASQIAKEFNIRIYTVGVGTMGTAPYPFQTPFGVKYQNVPVEIDEVTLKKIAETTNGNYFRATNNQKLKEIYNQIDLLEKTKVEVTSYKQAKELFYNWLLIGLILLLTEFLLSNTYLKKIP